MDGSFSISFLFRFISGATLPFRQRILAASLFFHPGFLIIDHIHFQYNGFLFGILLWSILMSRDVRVTHAAHPSLSFWCYRTENLPVVFFLPFFLTSSTYTYTLRYTWLVTHFDLPLSRFLQPAYFIYLLRSYCMSPSSQILPARFIALVNAVILVFALSLGPFILTGQAPQLLSRLFPFARGLNHAYWAPNAWALLTAGDRVLLLRM